jgi:stage V sporulation protein B
MAVATMAPAIVFQMMSGVLKGYFQGNGSRIPAIHSAWLQVIFLFVGGLIGANMMHGYGEKVSALLQNTDYASAYGAVGAAIGVVVASVLCFLHLLILHFLLKGKLKKQMGRELQRNQETTSRAIRMLVVTGLLHTAFYLVFFIHVPLEQYLVYHFGGLTQEADTLWGSYYGNYQVVLGIVAGISVLICLLSVKKTAVLLDHEEYRGAKERLGVLIHQCVVVAAPTAILLAVLAENILDVLFGGNNANTAQWLQLGSITVFVMVFGIIFLDMLLKLRRMKVVVGVGAVALLIYIVSAIILLAGLKMGIAALIISQILFWLAVTVPFFFIIGRMVQYRQEWIRSIAFPIVAAAIGGLIAMLLNKAFVSLLGNVATLIICIVFGSAAYLIILFALKDFTEEELELMPGGQILLALGRMLRLM